MTQWLKKEWNQELALWKDQQDWQNFNQIHQEKKREYPNKEDPIRNERGEVTTKQIWRIVRDYYEQLYANKLDNLGKMDKFLETCKLPELIQEESEYLNRLITNKKIEPVMKNIPANESPGPDDFTGEFYQSFKEELTPILLKLFQKFKRREGFQVVLTRPALF